MQEVQLSGGNTAMVREVDDMTRGDIRAAFRLADLDGAKVQSGELGMDVVGALQDAVLVRFIESWTFMDGDRPLTINMKNVKGLKLRDYNPLAAAVAPVLSTVMTGNVTPDPTSAEPSSTSDNTD